MTDDFDAIVVGARVAGASTARLLARMGHRVCLVDRARFPSDTLSTHALLRPAVLQLGRWGVLDRVEAAGAPPVRELTLGFGEDRVHTRLRAEHGVEALYAPRRYVLDALLVDAAIDAGAELLEGVTVTDVMGSAGRVRGVVADVGDASPRTLTARVVIGADGVRSRIARAVGAETRRHHEPTNAVHYAYYSGIDRPRFWFQFSPGVNAGLIATNDDLTCVFAGRSRRGLESWSADPDDQFRRLLARAGADLAEEVDDGTRVTPFRGTTGLPGHVRPAWGPGWALVGDAGCTIDPISAHGISGALRDAELCARGVDRWLRDPRCESDAMRDYERERDRLTHAIYEPAQCLATYGWTPDEASRLMRTISDAVRVECEHLASLPPLQLQHGAATASIQHAK